MNSSNSSIETCDGADCVEDEHQVVVSSLRGSSYYGSEDDSNEDAPLYRSVVSARHCTFAIHEEEAISCHDVTPEPHTHIHTDAHTHTHYVFPQEPSDPSVPPVHPGAGIYTSPLTVNVVNPIADIVRITGELLRVLQMPAEYDPAKFKYNVAAYFTSGFARYSVRIWSRSTVPGSYAVEIMRERGDRILVTRVFEMLTAVLGNEYELEVIKTSFHVDIFDWAPRKLPDDILAKLPIPSKKDVEEGIASMIAMVSSRYDDVAVNGCASVAKLAAASDRTRFNMASSHDLLLALLNVTLATEGPPLSVDTRTNAALGLSVLTQLPVGQQTLCAVGGEGSRLIVLLLTMCRKSTAVSGLIECPEYASLCFRMFCINTITNIFSVFAKRHPLMAMTCGDNIVADFNGGLDTFHAPLALSVHMLKRIISTIRPAA